MVRPRKEGLDYFPLDVDIAADEKVEYIEAKFGLVGFATIIHLLIAVYRNGYYINWGELEVYVTSKRINLEVNTLQSIVSQLVNIGFFDKEMFEKYSILTSKGIQTRYVQACRYRDKVSMVKEYCLLNPEDGFKKIRFSYKTLKKWVIPQENPEEQGVIPQENPEEQGVIPQESTQSIAKHSIAKNSKEKQRTTSAVVVAKKLISDFAGDDKDLEAALNDFLSMRKKIKKPLTDRALQQRLKKLQELSGGDQQKAAAIVDQTVNHCWQDFYPLKDGNDKNMTAQETDDKATEILESGEIDGIFD